MTSQHVTTNNPDFFDHDGFHPNLPVGSELPRRPRILGIIPLPRFLQRLAEQNMRAMF